MISKMCKEEASDESGTAKNKGTMNAINKKTIQKHTDDIFDEMKKSSSASKYNPSSRTI